ncbi:CUE domain [Popillia japonica]|uniref:CUE domain n=2 Tax=Scarabaeidae TaxID=7055 RepID=A0AAW1N6T8_POPJA
MMSSRKIAEQESTIKDSLFEFVKRHIPDADLTLIDEIVLSYVVAILEDVSSDLTLIDEIVLSYVVAILEDVSSDPVFDVEGFCEMMSAYFPEFESINHATVCQWMFELEAKLRSVEEEEPSERGISLLDLSLPEILPKAKARSDSNSESVDPPKRIHKISEVSDGGSTDSSCSDYIEEIDTLQEMFPHVCTLEIRYCLAIACGDVERATQILLHRQENGQSLNPNNSLTLHLQNQNKVIDDNELKNRIIERYSYVDKDSFLKEHRPVAPKVEPKKLVRYRDNKIVSLKGERYTEVKKGEEVDDVSLKKSKKGHSP